MFQILCMLEALKSTGKLILFLIRPVILISNQLFGLYRKLHYFLLSFVGRFRDNFPFLQLINSGVIRLANYQKKM